MKTEFRKAELPGEMRALQAFDRRIFSKADRFPASYWATCESWWMVIDRVRVGCCAFERNVRFEGDITPDGVNSPMAGSLYIATTGIAPAYQGCGFGTLLKAWEIGYARKHGFEHLLTNTRKSNVAMIALNRRFGFRVIRTTPGYYVEPAESTVVMELRLKG